MVTNAFRKRNLILKVHISFEQNPKKKKMKKFWFNFCYPFRFLGHLIASNKAVVLKSLLIVAVLASLAFATYGILYACGFTTVEDFTRLRDTLGDTFVFWLVIGLLQIVQVIFIPLSNQLITVPCAVIFNNELWKVFLTSWLSIWLATLILYAIGRWGGQKILNWLLKDKEQVEKCTKFINRGWIFFPLGMLLPFPDDIVTILAGTGKMKFWFVLIVTFLTRAIDVACSVWGFGFLGRYWWGWIILGLGIVALGVLTVVFWRWQRRKN